MKIGFQSMTILSTRVSLRTQERVLSWFLPQHCCAALFCGSSFCTEDKEARSRRSSVVFRADKASGRIGWEGGRVGSGWVGRDGGRGRLFTLQYGAKHAPPPSELSSGSGTELHCAAGIAERRVVQTSLHCRCFTTAKGWTSLRPLNVTL